MGITAKDLAKICGVSRTTIHRALTDTGRINEQTRTLILKTAEEYGYRPDLLARGLVKGKTMYIGVVLMDVNNRYFSQMLSAISVQARKKGYFINIALHEKNKEIEKEQLRRLADYRMDGIILSSINQGEEYKAFLEELEVPIVTIDNKIADGIPFVGIDEKAAAKEATISIMKKGYEKIVFVCPPLADQQEENVYVHEQRVEGFREAMASEPQKESALVGSADFLRECLEQLEGSKHKTAFFCSGDMFALDLMKFLRKKGMEAQKDYGIMGFDNIDTLEYVSPRLSTIYNGVEEVANTAVNMLFDLLDETGRMQECCILDYEFVEGKTL